MKFTRNFQEVPEALPGVAGAFGRQRPIDPSVGNVCRRQTWCRRGLQALVNIAKDTFEKTTGVRLPWNLSTHGPWVGYMFYASHEERREEMVRASARISGWLRAATKFPNLVRFIQRTGAGSRGMNSLHRYFDFYGIPARYSPGALARLLPKVRRRANEILKPYGLQVSNNSIAAVLRRNQRRVGKISIEAAAHSIFLSIIRQGECDLYPWGWWEDCPTIVREKVISILSLGRGLEKFTTATPAVKSWVLSRINAGEFSNLREALAASARLVPDSTDGVDLMIDPTLSTRRLGVECKVGWNREGELVTLAVQVGTSRTHHQEWGKRCFPPHQQVIERNAISAWRRQAEMERQNSALLSTFEKDEVEHLVLLEDSFSAGNCRPGTMSWLNSHGWHGRQFVRARELVLHAHDSRVQNVLNAAARRVQAMKKG